MQNQNESLNVNAKTVAEAIKRGLNQLGLTRDQVEIEIISESKRSLFGLKSENAQVRLTPKKQVEDTEEEVVEVAQEVQFTEADKADSDLAADSVLATTASSGDEEQAATNPNEEIARISVECLDGLLKHMGIEAKITTRMGADLVDSGEEAPLVLDITGKDMGILIGRRNETLQALQYMVRLMVAKKLEGWQRIVVDVESYRARRRQSLQQMAIRMAERAVANGERVMLESMSAYDRRLIHIALRDHPAVYTKSIGRDNNRKVTIIPK